MHSSRLPALVALGLACGCGSFGTSDAPVTDAGSDSSTLVSDGFDMPADDTCGGWSVKNATAVLARAEGRNGGNACRVCVAAAGKDFVARIEQTVFRGAAPGSTFTGEAWVRLDSAASDTDVYVSFAGLNEGQFQTGATTNASTYVRVTNTFSAARADETVVVGVSAQSSTKGCFFVDDVLVRRTR